MLITQGDKKTKKKGINYFMFIKKKINQNHISSIILKVVIAEDPETEYVWQTIRTDPTPEPYVHWYFKKAWYALIMQSI